MQLAIDSLNNVYVSDAHNYRIQKFKSDGTFVRAWVDTVQRPGNSVLEQELQRTQTIIYMWPDSGNNRIQKFKNDGNFISAWGTQGSEAGNSILQLELLWTGIQIYSCRILIILFKSFKQTVLLLQGGELKVPMMASSEFHEDLL